MYGTNYSSQQYAPPYGGVGQQPLFSGESPSSITSSASTANGLLFPSAPSNNMNTTNNTSHLQTSGRRMPPSPSVANALGSGNSVGGSGTGNFVVRGGTGRDPISPRSSNGSAVNSVYDPNRFAVPSAPGVMGGVGGLPSTTTRRVVPSPQQVSPPLPHVLPSNAAHSQPTPFHLSQFQQPPPHNRVMQPPPPLAAATTSASNPRLPISTQPPLFSSVGGGGSVLLGTLPAQGGTSRRRLGSSSGGGANYSSAHSDSSHTSRRSTPSQSTVGTTSATNRSGVPPVGLGVHPAHAGVSSVNATLNTNANNSGINSLGGSGIGFYTGNAGPPSTGSNTAPIPPYTTTVTHSSASNNGAMKYTPAHYAVSTSASSSNMNTHNVSNVSGASVGAAGGGGQSASSAKQTPSQPASEEHRQKQRRKQVAYGKVTQGYANYRMAVPLHERQKHNADHPVTPEITAQSSKRHWDSQVAEWRRALHKWDDPQGPAGHRKSGLRTLGELGLVQPESLEESRERARREIETWQQEVAAHRKEGDGEGNDAEDESWDPSHTPPVIPMAAYAGSSSATVGDNGLPFTLSPYLVVDGGGGGGSHGRTASEGSGIVGAPYRGPSGGGSAAAGSVFGALYATGIGHEGVGGDSNVRQWQQEVSHYDASLYKADSTSGSIHPPSHVGGGGVGGSSQGGFAEGGNSRYVSSHDGGDSNYASDSCASRETPRSHHIGPIGSSRGRGSVGNAPSNAIRGGVFNTHRGTARATHSSSSSVHNYRRNGSTTSSVIGPSGLNRVRGGSTFIDTGYESNRGGDNEGNASYVGSKSRGSKSLADGPSSTVKLVSKDAATAATITALLVAEQRLEQQGIALAAGVGIGGPSATYIGRSISNLGASGLGAGGGAGLASSDAGSALSSPQTPSISTGVQYQQQSHASLGGSSLLSPHAAARNICVPLVPYPDRALPRPYAGGAAGGGGEVSLAEAHQQEEAFAIEVEKIAERFVSRLGMQFNLDVAYWLLPDTASPPSAISADEPKPLPLEASSEVFKRIVIERVTKGVKEAFERQRLENERTAQAEAPTDAAALIGGGIPTTATTTARTSRTSMASRSQHSHNSDEEDGMNDSKHQHDQRSEISDGPIVLTWRHVTDTIVLPSIIYAGDLHYNPNAYGGYEDEEEEEGCEEDGGSEGDAEPSPPNYTDSSLHYKAFGDAQKGWANHEHTAAPTPPRGLSEGVDYSSAHNGAELFGQFHSNNASSKSYDIKSPRNRSTTLNAAALHFDPERLLNGEPISPNAAGHSNTMKSGGGGSAAVATTSGDSPVDRV